MMMGLVVWTVVGCGGDKSSDSGGSDLQPDTWIDLAAEGIESDEVDSCVTDEGQVFVVWVDDRDGTPGVWLNRSTDLGLTWLQAAVPVSHGDGNVFAPKVACNSTGTFVVWEDDRDGQLAYHQIYFNRSLDGGATWEAEDKLLESNDPDGLTYSQGPSIAIAGTDLYVAWFDNVNGAYDIYVAASSDAGNEWRNPVRVNSDEPAGSAFSAWPVLDATPGGRVYSAWQDSRSGASDIYFGRSENAASDFKPDERIDGGDAPGEWDSFPPQIASDGGNNIYVVWHDARNGEGRDIFFNYSGNAGADWLANAVRLDSDNAGFFDSERPRLTVSGTTAHVVWHDNRNGGFDVFYRTIEGGTPGDEEIRVNTDAAGFANSLNPIVTYSEDTNTVLVAWEDGRAEAETGADNGYNDLYYNFSTGAAFQEVDLRVDAMAPGESWKTQLQAHAFGNLAYYVWLDGRAGDADVYFHAWPIGEEAIFVEPETIETAAGR